MRINTLQIDKYKNIKDLKIDFSEKVPISVLIGQNGTGKSNLLEAIVIIFKSLDLNNFVPDFSFELEYLCNGHVVYVKHSHKDKKRIIEIDGVKISKKKFWEEKDEYLPKNVFAYYSGKEHRMEQHFNKHQGMFYDELLKGNDTTPLRRLFYAREVHSNFVLLAFFSFFEKENENFLREYFKIDGIESVLFVLHHPEWRKEKGIEKSDFWNAKGVVRTFLNDLYIHSLAPLKSEISIKTGIKKESKKEAIYLFLEDQKKLNAFAEKYKDNVEFFKYLESTYISDLIEEVKIKIQKTDGSIITFDELSEGEQQLITVLGLLKFTESQEAIFLLDEPDTHLNPMWKYNYLTLIEQIAKKSDTCQILLSTHDPIVIGGLKKESVMIFERLDGKTVVRNPDVDPKGLGVDGILTSDVFNMPTSLDIDSQRDIDRKRHLTFKKERTEAEERELVELEEKLSNIGISKTTRDPLYNKFLEKLYSRPEYNFEQKEWSEQETKLLDELLDEIEEEEKDELH